MLDHRETKHEGGGFHRMLYTKSHAGAPSVPMGRFLTMIQSEIHPAGPCELRGPPSTLTVS